MVFCYSATQKSEFYAEVLGEILNQSVYMLEADLDASKGFSFMLRCIWIALMGKPVPILNMPPASMFEEEEIYVCGPVWAGSPAAPLQYFLRNAPIKGKIVHMILSASISHTKHKENARQLIVESGCLPGHVESFATGGGAKLERDVIKAHLLSLIEEGI